MSSFDDLKELKAMLDRGEITQAEYDIVKADLLAGTKPDPSSKEPGWYNDPSGQASHQAYWDGQQWTGATRPGVSAAAASGVPAASAARTPPTGPTSKGFSVGKLLLYGLLGLVGVGVISTVAGNLAGDEVEETFAEIASGLDAGSSSGGSSDGTDAPASASPAPKSQFTRSEENAIRSAESYLAFTAFSRSGLIDQLEFEGFANAEAAQAVDYLDVDWKKQAALSAESYLAFTAFSRSGLIDQLEFEGFTTDQATVGVNSITVDWNEQAWRSAEAYLEFSSFSRSELIDQLLFEGFTQSQATYGVNKAGF